MPDDHPKRAEIAQAPSAEELISRFTFKETGAEVEAFDSSQDNIDKRTQIIEVGGVKTALLPKQTRGNTVVVKMRFNVGNNKELARSAIPMLSGAMLMRGTKTMTRDQIEDAFTANKMDGSPFSFTTDREHLAAALKLVGELFTQSSYPEKEFETLKSQTIAGLKARSDEPATLGRDAITKHFNTYPQGDARYSETSAELIADLEKVTLADVKRYYNDVFGLGLGYIAVVGDFDAAEVTAELKADVIDQKAAKIPFERIVAEYRPVEPARFVIDTPDKENADAFCPRGFASQSFRC